MLSRIALLSILSMMPGCRRALWVPEAREVAETARRATVALRDGPARWNEDAATGCGVFISRREVLTVGHALKGGGGLQLELHDGSKRWARVVKSLSGRASAQGPLLEDVTRDLALLRLDDGEGGTSNWLPIADVDAAYGEQVFLVGAPQGVFGAAVVAIVSHTRDRSMTLVGHPLEPGWSGAPLVDRLGQLVGIVSRGSTSVSAAISASSIQKVLPELRRTP